MVLVDEQRIDGFAELFGARRGSGCARDDDCIDEYPRCARYPGPLLELRLSDGTAVAARVVRIGDLGGWRDTPHVDPGNYGTPADRCAVELLYDARRTVDHPHGEPANYNYFVGALRREGTTMYCDSTRRHHLAREDVERLLDWVDAQFDAEDEPPA